MTIALDDITRKKLILVRQLYQRALLQAEARYSHVDRILALIGFDYTNETVLRSLITTLDARKAPPDGFQGVVQQADNLLLAAGLPEVPDKARIQHIHNLRNDAQHKAKYPNEMDVSDARTYTRDFLEQIISNVWGHDLESISLTDIVNDPKVQTYLKEAEVAIRESKYRDAVIKSVAALEWTISEVKGSIVGRIPYSTRAFIVKESFGGPKASTEVFKTFEHMRDLLMRSMIGMTLPDYLRFKQISTSVVQAIMFFQDGNYTVNLAGRTPDKDEAEYVVSFATNAVVQVERLVGDINKPFEI